MKRCSTLVIREMQIKTTLKCHFIPTGKTIIKKKETQTIARVNKDVEKVELSHIADGDVKWCIHVTN